MVPSTSPYARRAFLSWCLGALAMGPRLPPMYHRRAMRGLSSSMLANCARAYRDLEAPVLLPLAAIAVPWRPVSFEARVLGRDPDAGAVLLDGILLRTQSEGAAGGAGQGASGSSAAVRAFCRLCPHEICHVELQSDTSRLELEAGATPEHPLLVCPCHFSVFNPLSDGALISGPAYRGLYRFKVQVKDNAVEITQVEEGVLTLFDAASPEEEALTLLDTVSPEKEALTLLDGVSPSREER